MYTKGTWTVVPFENSIGEYYIQEVCNKLNSAFDSEDEELHKRAVKEDNANARLISRAPDLVNSLTDCADQLRMFLELHEDDEDAPKILETAEKLLAKINKEN